jgi:hypothetical protein
MYYSREYNSSCSYKRYAQIPSHSYKSYCVVVYYEKMSNASSNNYSSDSDSSSDDEYLTGKHEIQGDEGEREAIISRKLLESFFGRSTNTIGKGETGNSTKLNSNNEIDKSLERAHKEDDADFDVQEDSNSIEDQGSRHMHRHQARSHVGSTNLDSTHFVPHQYAHNLILTTSTEALLVETEKLGTPSYIRTIPSL